MKQDRSAKDSGTRVVVIGAGIAGLSTAARLAHAGYDVQVLERYSAAGGKIRCLPSDAGPVDTGPTVLTMRHVFDDLFESIGERIEDHVELIAQPLLARHFWRDGSQLDLFHSRERNNAAIRDFAGEKAARQFNAFCDRTKLLFDGFDAPMMQAPEPSLPKLAAHVMRHPKLALKMAPLSTLHSLLNRSFDDSRLVQLLGRYATYVGGSPYASPALLSLIWQAESAGVWVVRGGMHKLAQALEAVAFKNGASFTYDAHVAAIKTDESGVQGVTLDNGEDIRTRNVVFNGDPRALASGALGANCASVAPQTKDGARSLSAQVWAFAARPNGSDLAYHNVFFRDAPKPEFDALANGQLAPDPTLYICALDRATDARTGQLERFEIIANAPPTTLSPDSDQQEFSQCQTRTFQTLAQFGLHFDPVPDQAALTTPRMFDQLFPMTAGSLYGQSPHGTTAAFQRPTARTKIKGLYLAGGGTHPGAGLPMATLSGRHAAEAILNDRTSTSMFRRTDTRGGISTGSATMARAPSVSSGS